MSLSAQSAVMLELRAENTQLRANNAHLTAEVEQLRATVTIDAERIKRLLAAQPVLRHSPRMGAA